MVNLQNKNMKILIGISIALTLIIVYRIYDNIQTEKARAAALSRNRVVSVETGHPVRMTIQPELEFSGSLDPEWRADVAAKVEGRIEKVFVREGDKVKKGAVLAKLEPVDTEAELLAAQGEYRDAETVLRKAESDLARYTRLYEQGAISEQVMYDYKFAKDNAAAKLETARGTWQAKKSLADGTEIIAPADGVVYKRYFQEGYYAKAGEPLFAIADIAKLKTVINVPEGHIAGISVGNTAKIILPAFENKGIIGTVTRIAPVADLPEHTFSTEISVDNTEGLYAGVFATVKLQAKPKNDVLTIPLYAIVMRDDQKTAFVVDENGVVKRRVLSVGYMNDKIAEILGGLDEKDLVVTGGQNKLREGSKVTVNKEGK